MSDETVKKEGQFPENDQINSSNKDHESYFNEQGQVVFTASFLLKRGKCCTNGCINCPYPKFSSR